MKKLKFTLVVLFTVTILSAQNNTSLSGTFTDSRDNNKYKWVKIGDQSWMAQNLNYAASGAWEYKNDTAYSNIYGRLYNWETAKKVCPKAWHLPTDKEWTTLEVYLGGSNVAGQKLKAKNGWNENGNGTDEYGFTALPGGYRYSSDGGFFSAGKFGGWWTSTQSDGTVAWRRKIYYNNSGVYRYDNTKNSGYSVRCIKN